MTFARNPKWFIPIAYQIGAFDSNNSGCGHYMIVSQLPLNIQCNAQNYVWVGLIILLIKKIFLLKILNMDK